MDKDMSLLITKLASIWAATELTKAWATGGKPGPTDIAGRFNDIYSMIETKIKSSKNLQGNQAK